MSLSRRLPVFWLTVRQFRAGRAIRVVGFFAAIPIILSAIHLLSGAGESARWFYSHLFLEGLSPTTIPLATLVLATTAFGNEISDRTLPYLVLKPVSRVRLVLEKYLSASAMVILIFLSGLAIAWGIVAGGGDAVDGRALLALLVASAAAILAYGALFLLVSLAVPRALMVGIIYVLIWESLLARFIPGIRLASIRYFTQCIYVRILDDPAVTVANLMRLPGALAVLGALVFVSVLLASARLRRMELD